MDGSTTVSPPDVVTLTSPPVPTISNRETKVSSELSDGVTSAALVPEFVMPTDDSAGNESIALMVSPHFGKPAKNGMNAESFAAIAPPTPLRTTITHFAPFA
jgi:hypothetical protein